MSQINSTSVLEIQRLKREKKERERVLAISKLTGLIVVLDHKREFDPRFHEVYVPMREDEGVCEVTEVTPVVSVQVPASADSFAEQVKAQRAELKELQAKKAWLSSDPVIKERHAALKAIYG